MTCPACDDTGMVYVSPATAAKLAGPLVIPPGADQQTAARLEAEHDARLHAAENTVYPCRACNGPAFARWLAGDYHPTGTIGQGSRRRVPRETPVEP